MALVAAQGSVSGPAWASTRLLGLDPSPWLAAWSELAPAIEKIADAAAAQLEVACRPRWDDGAALPACAAPLLEIGAERQARWEVRLFAS